MKGICDYAHKCEQAKYCRHGRPHEVVKEHGEHDICVVTFWRKCKRMNRMAKCKRVKEEKADVHASVEQK